MYKFLIILGLLFSANVTSAESFTEEVTKHFIVNADEESSILNFLDEESFSLCESKDVTLSLQYAFSEVRLKSTRTYDDRCAVLLITETEMGEEKEQFCDLDIVKETDWTRNELGDILLMPPKCDEAVLHVDLKANVEEALFKTNSNEVDIVKSFFVYLFSIFIGMLAFA